MLLPVAAALVLFCGNSLYLLAESCLTGQVLFLLGTDALEVLLVTLVDDCRGGLEAVPYLLAQFLGYRTDLAIFLMQLL